MRKIKTSSAFTLIEILFVLIILAAMAALFLSLYPRQAETQKIGKTALEMQAILQAASTYYVDYKAWPASLTDKNFVTYLPYFNTSGGYLENPWGGTFKATPGADDFTFTVTADGLPSAGVGSRLAARLPNARCLSNAKKCSPTATIFSVQASVGVPGQSQQPTAQGPILVSMGTANAGSTVKVTCPTDMVPCLYTSPTTFDISYIAGGDVAGALPAPEGGAITRRISSFNVLSTNCPTNQNQCTFTLVLDILGKKQNDILVVPPPIPTVTYIGICQLASVKSCSATTNIGQL